MDARQQFGVYNHAYQSYVKTHSIVKQRTQSSHSLLVEPSLTAVTKQLKQ
jgi:hypothetical protein